MAIRFTTSGNFLRRKNREKSSSIRWHILLLPKLTSGITHAKHGWICIGKMSMTSHGQNPTVKYSGACRKYSTAGLIVDQCPIHRKIIRFHIHPSLQKGVPHAGFLPISSPRILIKRADGSIHLSFSLQRSSINRLSCTAFVEE